MKQIGIVTHPAQKATWARLKDIHDEEAGNIVGGSFISGNGEFFKGSVKNTPDKSSQVKSKNTQLNGGEVCQTQGTEENSPGGQCSEGMEIGRTILLKGQSVLLSVPWMQARPLLQLYATQ